MSIIKDFWGYRRENGDVGIRNHVAVVSIMDNVNPLGRQIASLVEGAIFIPTIAGRGQFGQDKELNEKTMLGLGKNPNIAALLVVSLEPSSASDYADKISEINKPAKSVSVQEAGSTVDAIARGVKELARLKIQASEIQREKCSVKDLIIGVECGGTDTTSGITANPIIGRVADSLVDAGGRVVLSETSEFMGAEHVLSKRAANKEIEENIINAVKRIEDDAISRGVDIRGANPVPDNIRGGITTIEEKSLGAIMKGGSKTIQDFLSYAERPTKTGLNIMDTAAPAVESITGLSAGGCQLILFSTGVGNSIGHMVTPTVKISGNPNTAKSFAINLDVDLSDVTLGKAKMEDRVSELWTEVIKYSSGKKTCSEVLIQTENAPSKIQPTV